MCVVWLVEVISADVLEDVEGNERDAGGVRGDHRRRRGTREVFARQVRVPARVDDERLLQSAQTVQYDASRRTTRQQGLRHRHAQQLQTQVSHDNSASIDCHYYMTV